MRLVIVRHGEAEAYSGTATDAARRLTAQGQNDIQRLGEWLTGRELGVQRVIASPYVRAQQSAALLANKLTGRATVETASELHPNASPRAAIELLANSSAETVLLASHQPLVGRLLNLLVDEANLPGFFPACCAIVEANVIAAGCAELVDFVSADDV